MSTKKSGYPPTGNSSETGNSYPQSESFSETGSSNFQSTRSSDFEFNSKEETETLLKRKACSACWMGPAYTAPHTCVEGGNSHV